MPDVKRYSVIDQATGEVVNIVMWDGVTPWSPGEGFTVREAVNVDQIVEQPPE